MPTWLTVLGLALAGAAGAQEEPAGPASERDVELPALPELDGDRAVELNVDPPGLQRRERVHRIEPEPGRPPIPERGVDSGFAREAIPSHATEVDFHPTRVRTRGIDTRYHDTEIRTHRIGAADGGRIRHHGPDGRF